MTVQIILKTFNCSADNFLYLQSSVPNVQRLSRAPHVNNNQEHAQDTNNINNILCSDFLEQNTNIKLLDERLLPATF